MKVDRKAITSLCVSYLVLAFQIISNTNVVLMQWRKLRNRRKRLLNLLSCTSALLDLGKCENLSLRKKRTKNKVRSNDWWQRIVQREFKNEDWIENFRVSKETFQYIVNELKNALQPKENFLNIHRNIASVEKKVAVALYFLGSCCEYRLVANAFGIHKSTVHNIVHEFVLALNKVLLPNYIQMPNECKALEVSSYFKEMSNLPNVIGAIDGTHIPILPPKKGYRVFINRKGWPSLVLQAVADHKYKFVDICIKNPGCTHDAAVLASSKLYQNIEAVLPKNTIELNGQYLPYVLLGDPAYPLLPWLLKPYSSHKLTPEQDSFNVYMSSARVVVEIAFGRLKARWRILLKRSDIDYHFVPDMVAACCTLHNIIEDSADGFPQNWMEEVRNAEILFSQPPNKSTRTYDSFSAFPLRKSREILE